MPAQSQVLARKYRPQVFDDLIGQEALVQTITNAIAQNRLAQAYMLTGIRGVGKTTSARIIAKGLNCVGPDGKGGMTPNPCGKCKHCLDIANDSHIDVIEIDAASNTGVDNIREIIEGAKYNPVSARYKIYIIDEVHMLSKAAFNALLKTLEEPPERVKFIFATTEIRKVPLTILSRCQRFDLKRVSTKQLTQHLSDICKKEHKNFSQEVLSLIAKAGSGSVRDSLSLLDQAMTQLPNNPSITDIRQMLGTADKSSLINLYQAVLTANMSQVFDLLKRQYEEGVNALNLTQDLLDLTHTLTCLKVITTGTEQLEDFTEEEQQLLKDIAHSASMHALTANWQILIKGIAEVRTADNPFQALEMLAIQMAYLSDISTPEQLLDEIKKNPVTAAQTVNPVPANTSPASEPTLNQTPTSTKNREPDFKDITEIIAFARQKGERILAFNIETFVRPIQISNGLISCSLAPNTPHNFVTNFSKFLFEHTQNNWTVQVEKAGGQPSVKEQKETKQQQLLNEIKKDETISEIEKLFTGAKIEKIKPIVSNEEVADTTTEDES